MREIFKEKGFDGELLEKVVAKISENEDHWVDMMMKHELKMIPDRRTSVAVALATFTGTAFVLIGWLKAKVTETNSGKVILETLLLGIIAASLAYLVGDLLEGVF